MLTVEAMPCCAGMAARPPNTRGIDHMTVTIRYVGWPSLVITIAFEAPRTGVIA